MAQDFLSQEEVDALLKGVTGEPDEQEAEEHGGDGVRPYNLATQERIVRGRMPTMELINERFARYLRIGLFNYMHRTTDISVGPIRVQKYSEFIRNLVVPTNLNLIHMKPLRGTGLFIFDPDFVFLVVDNLFGSDGRYHVRVEGRDFTPTEQRIIRGLLNVVFTEYSRSWKPVYDISFEYIRSEMNSQFANIATPSEIVVSTTFTLEFGGATADIARAEKVNSDMVTRAIGMDGTCTGEHGVGMHKMAFLVEEHGEGAIDTMRALKHALDPKNIMNPGKIVRW